MPFANVSAINPLSEGIFELVLNRDGMEFQPGDCLAISNSEGVSRPYSVSSGNREPHLRFVIRRLPDGAVSEWLAARVPDDRVEISEPFGWFRPRSGGESGHPSVFVATGTGIAPFLSVLRSFPDSSPVLCLYGVRCLADAVGLETLRGRWPLRLCVSRQEAPPHHFGRITDLLDEIPRTQQTHYYLCGLDAMIDEVSQWLERRGVHVTQIHREVFFNA